MFSKELQILDENTVQYMMDEMQEEIDALGNELDERKRLLLEEKDYIIRQLQAQLSIQ